MHATEHAGGEDPGTPLVGVRQAERRPPRPRRAARWAARRPSAGDHGEEEPAVEPLLADPRGHADQGEQPPFGRRPGQQREGGVPRPARRAGPPRGRRAGSATSEQRPAPRRSARVETTTKTSTQQHDQAGEHGPGHCCGQRSPTCAASDAGGRQPDDEGEQRQPPLQDQQPHGRTTAGPRGRCAAGPRTGGAARGRRTARRRPGSRRRRPPPARPDRSRRRQPGRSVTAPQAQFSARSTASAPARSARVVAGELHQAAVGGVREAEPDGVQPLPGDAEPGGQRRVGAVGQVADARVPERGEVDPDLVGAPGLELDVDQARGRERLDDLVVGDRRAAAG